jgi:digeranylgeranylglycerophospholipid reductase
VILIERDPGGDRPANTVFQGMANVSGIDFRRWSVHQVLGMRIISPAGHHLPIDARGYYLDRSGLDRHLLKEASDLGVTILKAKAEPMHADRGKRLISASMKSAKEPRMDEDRELPFDVSKVPSGSSIEIEASVVIDAGGVDSELGLSAGLEPMRHREDIAWAAEAHVEFPSIGEEDRFEYFVGSVAPGWKATFSPSGGDRATLGVFVRGFGRDVDGYLYRFIERFKRHKEKQYARIDRLKVTRIGHGGDPIAVIPGRLVDDGLMVTGGAAGQSGMAYAMRAGAICGTVAGNASLTGETRKRSLREYERIWHREFANEYRLGRACLQTLQGMSDDEIDSLTRSLGGRHLLSGGPLHQKAAFAARAVAAVMPGVIPSLIANLVKG